METKQADPRIRVWPGVVIVALQWLLTFGSGLVAPSSPIQFFGMTGGPVLGLVLLWLWWGLWSRASKGEKLVGLVLPVAALLGAGALAHPSSVPMTIYIYGLTTLCLLFVLTVALSSGWRPGARRLALTVAILVGAGGWTLVRTEGVDGDMAAEFSPRWQQTAEERLLAAEDELSPPPPIVAAAEEQPTTGADSAAGEPPSGGQASQETDGANEEEVASSGAEDPAADPPTAALGESEIEGADVAQVAAESPTPPPVPEATSPWPGFRGPDRDGVVPGVVIATDWQASPPEELWRRPVGPGWGSFVVDGDLLYTQEQRGDDEVVSAYRASSGEPVWRHRDAVRFWEALAGAGPRATPMVHEGTVYSLGATGLLNALRAEDGALLWRRNAAEDTGAPTPEWGFSSSPLVVDGLVVIHTGGPEGKGVVAYDAASGEPRWFAPAGPLSYSSAHLATLHGVRQLIVLTGDGAASYAPGDGAVLWQHAWPMANGARIVQPVVTPQGTVLVGTGFGMGLRRLDVQHAGGGWTVEERWTSTGLKPYFNDLVLHQGHAYGFDGRLLSAVDFETGERVWKGGRYGSGQLLLLAQQDLLVVLSDRGVLALVAAKPDGFEELARLAAIEGKTWNHPTLVDGVLYVRNGEEMAAFRLPVQAVISSLD